MLEHLGKCQLSCLMRICRPTFVLKSRSKTILRFIDNLFGYYMTPLQSLAMLYADYFLSECLYFVVRLYLYIKIGTSSEDFLYLVRLTVVFLWVILLNVITLSVVRPIEGMLSDVVMLNDVIMNAITLREIILILSMFFGKMGPRLRLRTKRVW